MKYSLISAVFVVTTLFLFTSCTDVRSKVIPKDQSKWDTELKPYVEKLSDEEKGLVAKYIVRAKLGEAFGAKEQFPDGVTIGEAISKQKEFEQEQSKKELEAKLLKEKVEAEKAELSKKVNELLTVAFVKKTFQKSDFMSGRIQDSITIEFAFENKGSKDISGFKGTTEFSDMFGDKVKTIQLNYDKDIPAGKTVSWIGNVDYNQFMDDDIKFRNLESEKMKFSFAPEMVIFKDGTKLEISKN